MQSEQMILQVGRWVAAHGAKRHSRRRVGSILSVLSAASLLVFLATAILWVHSRNCCHFYKWGNASREFELVSGNGLVFLHYAPDTSLINPLHGWKVAHNDSPSMPWTGIRPGPRLGGFALYLLATVGKPAGNWRIGGQRLFILYFPHWSVAILASCLPLYCGFRLMIGRRRKREGHCVHCGYNLTGNVSGVCPECGEKI
jgi:hypothetical protein